MSYTYKRPEGKLTKVSIRKWNNTFSRRGRWPFIVAYVYMAEDRATIHYKIGAVGKITLFALLPALYLFGVFAQGHSETVDDLKRSIWQNKYGSFSSDVVFNNSNSWFKVKALLGHYD